VNILCEATASLDTTGGGLSRLSRPRESELALQLCRTWRMLAFAFTIARGLCVVCKLWECVWKVWSWFETHEAAAVRRLSLWLCCCQLGEFPAEDLWALYTVGDWDHGKRDRVVRAGGLRPLVQLLSCRHFMACKGSAQALAGLSEEARVASAVVTAGAIPPLLTLLRSPGFPSAALALRRLAMHPCGQEAMARAGGIPLLVNAVASPELSESAAGALSQMLERHRAELDTAVVVPALIRILLASAGAGAGECETRECVQLLRVLSSGALLEPYSFVWRPLLLDHLARNYGRVNPQVRRLIEQWSPCTARDLASRKDWRQLLVSREVRFQLLQWRTSVVENRMLS
jgi:hypothetical protein